MVKLQLDNLGAHYGQREIISGVSSTVFSGGQVVAVVGPNAAGKSTLFKRIAGLIDGPGQVILQDSKKVRQASATCRRA
jgi:iron complex transport system ATP-binding protein